MKILCVDDSNDIAGMLKDVLEAHGHYVYSCNNGLDALSLIKKENFNLILLDLSMPGFSGTDVIESLAKTDFMPDLNIVILSAEDLAKSQIIEFEQKGVKGFMQKPVRIDEILELIKKFE